MNLKKMKIDDLLSKAAFSLNKVSETPNLDAEILLSYLLEISRFDLFMKRNDFLSEDFINKFQGLINRRLLQEPVAYITKEKAFFEDIFFVDRRVLIPRPETEFLVVKATEYIKKNGERAGVLDMCCGSGCAGLSIMRVADCDLTLSDISQEALDVAEINAKKLFPDNKNIKFIKSDLFQNITGRFDIITANPPYLSKSDMENFVTGPLSFEPERAFYGGEKGVEITLDIIRNASDFLNRDGILAIELGYEGLELIKNQHDMNVVEIAKDYSDIDRVIIFRKKD